MKTKSQIRDSALYHLDMLLWIRKQSWSNRFIPIINDAQEFRDELMLEKISGEN